MRSYKAQKAALTRAINSGDNRRIIAEVDKFYDEYNYEAKPLPDAWHRWDIAKRDAMWREVR